MAVIVIYTSGTFGDHWPFLALGRSLQDKGHRVRMVINQAMHPSASQLGLEAVALPDIERGPEYARAHAHAWDFWNYPHHNRANQPDPKPFDLHGFVLQAGALAQLCQGADLFISTSIRALGFVVQQMVELPWLTVSVNPYTFWQPGTAEEQGAKLRALQLEYAALKPQLLLAFKELGIRRRIPPWSPGWLFAPHVLLASSRHFSCPDLNQFQPFSSIDITGFWNYRDPASMAWQADSDLHRFMERSPIVLSFSSQPLEKPAKALRIHARAASRLKIPLLVQRGWADFSEEDLPAECERAEIMFTGFLPHDWLFARAACAVQHGGIGSIAQALRQGCPLLIEPYGNDQLYNASRVAANLKVGAAMHPFKMSEDGLVEVLGQKVLSREMKTRAKALGDKLRQEDGLARACQEIETYLQRCGKGKGSVCSAPYILPLQEPASVKESGRRVKGTRIPKILHQTWKDAHLPAELARFQRSWQSCHPDWSYRLWTDEDNRQFLRRYYPWFIPVYDAYPEQIMRVDAVRYFLLFHFGGVYVDLDFECLKPIDDLLEGKQLVLGSEPDAHLEQHQPTVQPFQKMVCNAFMASRPGHPFWEHLFTKLIVYRQAPDPLDATGPFLLTTAHASYGYPEDISILSEGLLYPLEADTQERPIFVDPVQRSRIARSAYGIHYWHCSWWPTSVTARAKSVAIRVLDHGNLERATTLDEIETGRRTRPQGRRQAEVSCILVAGGGVDAMLCSIHCFRRQTYGHKELLIVVDHGMAELVSRIAQLQDPEIRCIEVASLASMEDGGWLALAAEAGGEFIACWHGGDLFAPHRLEVQMAVLQELQLEASFLQRLQYCWPEKAQLIFSAQNLWENSLVCKKSCCTSAFSQARGKKPQRFQEIADQGEVALIDFPQLYLIISSLGSPQGRAGWEAIWQEETACFDGDLYEVLMRNIQNSLRLDLSPWLGPQTLALNSISVNQGVPRQEENGQPVIPRILHQTWKDEDLPPDCARYRQTWRQQHLDWSLCLWTDADIQEFIRRNYGWFLPVFAAYPEQIMRVDAARYFILFHYGGVYVDLDFECLKPIDALLESGQVVVGREPDPHRERHARKGRIRGELICNAFMASPPGHPFWPHLFAQLSACSHLPDPLDATGPFMLSRAYASYPGRYTLTLLPAELLYPICNETCWDDLDASVREQLAAKAYGVHHWQGSWWRETVDRSAPALKLSLYLQGQHAGSARIEQPQAQALISGLEDPPRISCLMVTKDRPLFAQRAIRCFQQQYYQNRELIIIDDSTDEILKRWIRGLNDSRVVYFALPPEGKCLGELRNIAVAKATGSYLAQWDDDDLSDRDRLSMQLFALKYLKAKACFLERQQIWWPESRRFAISCRRLWEGSFLCEKEQMPLYPELSKGEDTVVSEQIVENGAVALLDLPRLYTYIFHGANTFDAAHWEALWEAATESYEGDLAESRCQALLPFLGKTW